MKREYGFTLLELAIATAIAGFIFTILGVAMYQVLTIPESGNDHLTAQHELQNVAHWLSLDAQMAKSATGGSSLVLTLSDNTSVTYSLAGKELRRRHGTSNMTLAKNIKVVNFSVQNRYITTNITSAPAGRWGVSENKTYMTYLRPG